MFNETEFEVQKVRAKVTNKQIADELGIDESTLYRKVKAGGNFTRREMGILIKFMNMDDPMSVFFDEKLA